MSKFSIRGLAATGTRDSTTFLRGDGTWDVPPGSGTPTFHGGAAVRSTAQSIPDNTVTAVLLNGTEEYDPDGMHSPSTNPSRITIPTGLAGVWQFTGSLAWVANNNGDRMLLWLKNGTSTGSNYGYQNGRAPANGALRKAQTSTLEINLAVGDYIELGAHQITGGAINLDLARVAWHYIGAP